MLSSSKNQSRFGASNSGLPLYKCGALPSELNRQKEGLRQSFQRLKTYHGEIELYTRARIQPDARDLVRSVFTRPSSSFFC